MPPKASHNSGGLRTWSHQTGLSVAGHCVVTNATSKNDAFHSVTWGQRKQWNSLAPGHVAHYSPRAIFARVFFLEVTNNARITWCMDTWGPCSPPKLHNTFKLLLVIDSNMFRSIISQIIYK